MSTATHKTYVFPSELASNDLLRQVQSLPYRERRRYAWHNFSPKFERFTYRYSFFDSNNQASVARAEDVLLRSQLWLSAPQDFNDPFDCQAEMIEEKNALKRRIKVDQILRRFEPNLSGLKRKRRVDQLMTRAPSEWFETISKVIQDDVRSLGVVCFSDNPRSLLMWSHYARNHTGICYQYESLNDLNLFVRAMQVEYTKIYPTFNAFTYRDDDSIKMLLTKYKDWEYEKERRIVAPGGAHRYLSFSPSALTGVILGARTTDSEISALLEIIKAREAQELPRIRVFQIRQHRSSYRLTIHRKIVASQRS